MEPELKTELEKINRTLVGIFHKTDSLWRAFARGVLQGMGSIVGVTLALVVIGWILNSIGVIPAFREQAKEWQSTLDEIKRVR